MDALHLANRERVAPAAKAQRCHHQPVAEHRVDGAFLGLRVATDRVDGVVPEAEIGRREADTLQCRLDCAAGKPTHVVLWRTGVALLCVDRPRFVEVAAELGAVVAEPSLEGTAQDAALACQRCRCAPRHRGHACEQRHRRRAHEALRQPLPAVLDRAVGVGVVGKASPQPEASAGKQSFLGRQQAKPCRCAFADSRSAETFRRSGQPNAALRSARHEGQRRRRPRAREASDLADAASLSSGSSCDQRRQIAEGSGTAGEYLPRLAERSGADLLAALHDVVCLRQRHRLALGSRLAAQIRRREVEADPGRLHAIQPNRIVHGLRDFLAEQRADPVDELRRCGQEPVRELPRPADAEFQRVVDRVLLRVGRRRKATQGVVEGELVELVDQPARRLRQLVARDAEIQHPTNRPRLLIAVRSHALRDSEAGGTHRRHARRPEVVRVVEAAQIARIPRKVRMRCLWRRPDRRVFVGASARADWILHHANRRNVCAGHLPPCSMSLAVSIASLRSCGLPCVAACSHRAMSFAAVGWPSLWSSGLM